MLIQSFEIPFFKLKLKASIHTYYDRYFLAMLLGAVLWQTSFAQDSLVTYTQHRKWIVGGSSAALTSGSLVYLHQAWYKNYNTGAFHFFNDNAEWFGIDKVGHTFTTYQTARLMRGAFAWAGFKPQQQLWIGGTLGLGYMTAIEIMDGHSQGWGFSWGDMGANGLGTALDLTQELVWHEQRLQLKFSYSPSGLAGYNPRLLGRSFSEQILKDYNGQTYWLSLNLSAFMKQQSRFPKWLNVALGYGAQGMIGASTNPPVNAADGRSLVFERRQQYYLSVDIDLTRIKTKSVFLKRCFSVIGLLKIPAPAIELSNGKWYGHALYF